MPWSFAPLSTGDVEVLGREHNRIWRVSYAGLLPAARLDALDDAAAVQKLRDRATWHERYGQSVDGSRTLVAHDNSGSPVGWITVGPARDSDGPTDVELWSLYVVPEEWGSGLASELFTAHVTYDPIYLWVLEGNHRAVAFYSKVGFNPDGMTKLLDPLAGPDGGVERRMVRP